MSIKDKARTKKLPSTAIIIIIIIGIIFMAAAFGMLVRGINNQILATNIDSMEELAAHDLRSVKNSVEIRWEVMEGVVRQLQDADYKTEDEFFVGMRKALDILPSVDRVITLDSEGTEYTTQGLVRENSYLADTCKGREGAFAIRLNNVTYFRENVHELLILAVPAGFDVCGHKMEWLICQFPISILESELKIDSYDGVGYSSVIDAEGNFVINISRSHDFGSYDNFFEKLKEAEFEGYSGIDELRTTTTTTGATSVVYTMDGQEYIMVITAVDFTDWFFVSTVPTYVFDKQTNAIMRIFLLLLAVIAAIVIVILFIFFRQRQEREKLRIAEASSKAKTEFLFNMSHDIRTPMNAILGYTDIALRHKNEADKTEESLKKIKIAGGHLLNLINDILEMSRIEAGRMELTNKPLDMRRAINGVALMNQSLAVAKSIEFTVDVEEITDPFVYADELHINEIIINLLSNAIKYTPKGGKVKYTAKQVGLAEGGIGTYRFEIADNGIGMSEEFQTHLFEAFTREGSADVAKVEGAGLGLSIVKRIVDLAGGTIRVESKIDEGSTFIVELPLKVMTEEEIADFLAKKKSGADIIAEKKFDGKRVLLVEDNEMNREIATDILTEAGLIVEEAYDGEIAVQTVANKGIEYYDFILMDIQMPVMDGFEATRAIRSMQDGGRIPIIGLSANAFEEDKKASADAGMNDHVAKPIDVRKLFASIGKYV